MNKKLLVFGYGYVSSFLSDSLSNDGWQIYATCRTEEKKLMLIRRGIIPLIWDDKIEIKRVINEIDNIFVTIPPSIYGDVVLEQFKEDIVAISAKITWLGYCSATSVYGDHSGAWVNEKSEVKPVTERGKARLHSEKLWSETFEVYKSSLKIFRIAGIYGPMRNPFEKLSLGKIEIVSKKGQVFSRIHVDDIVGIIKKSIENSSKGGVYNLADDLPSSNSDFIKEAANILGVNAPPTKNFEDANLSEMAKSFYLECKQVSNEKVKSDFEYKFKYPTYKLGLLAEYPKR